VPVQEFGEARRQLGVVVEAEDRVGLGQFGGQLLAVTLGQAANGNDLGPGVGGGEQGVDGVLLGLLDEPTGVHHDQVGLRAVGDQLEAAIGEAPGQLLGVHLVAGATHGEQGHTRVADRG